MEPSVGVTVKCESNCFQWCPRKCKSSCCSVEKESDDEVIKSADKVANVALKEQNKHDGNQTKCCVLL